MSESFYFFIEETEVFFFKKYLTFYLVEYKIKQTKVRKTYFCIKEEGKMNFLKNRTNVITYIVNKNVSSNILIGIENGEVVVRAPWYLSGNEIQEIVEEKRKWILARLEEKAQSVDYIKTKKVKILGEDFHLKIGYKNVKVPELTVEEKDIKIDIPTKYKRANKTEILKLAIQKMYEKIAEEQIEHIMEKTRLQLGVMPEDYKLERMKNTLASCDENRVITINPDIVAYSKETIEYVVLHEFCHLIYKNHTKSFYNKIKQYMPDYEKRASEISKLRY